MYSWDETLRVSDSSSVHHQEFLTVHTAMVHVIQVRWQLVHKLSANLYNVPLLCVQWKTPDDGQRNCPKHVEFHPKNKFENLVHLVGFIIRNVQNSLHNPLYTQNTLWISYIDISPINLCLTVLQLEGYHEIMKTHT
jgi:hypothetical protein